MSYKRVTIKAVATAAGVSTQTISRVVNGRPDVSPETREHVQEIIDKLGYQPSKIARSLIRGQSFSLGVVSYGISLYGPALVLQGIQEATVQSGYSFMLNILPDAEVYDADKIVRDIMSYHVDGILWAVPEIGQNRDWIQQILPKISVPIVFLNVQSWPMLIMVVIDNRHGGRLATRHLIEQGRQHIGIITGPMNWWEARQRELVMMFLPFAPSQVSPGFIAPFAMDGRGRLFDLGRVSSECGAADEAGGDGKWQREIMRLRRRVVGARGRPLWRRRRQVLMGARPAAAVPWGRS